jgi:fatty-acyl-CoA synthase
VKEVAVVGLPDANWAERVHAVVVLRDGAAVDKAGLLDRGRDRLAGYKRPRSCSSVREDDKPRNALGKVLHRALKARLAAERSGMAGPSKGGA